MGIFYVYIGISFLITFFIVRRTRPAYPLITFIICFWIFVSDVANMDGIKISLGAFDLQPLRLLFLLFSGFLIINPFVKQYNRKYQPEYRIVPVYEKYMLGFIALATVSYIFHHSADIVTLFVYLTTLASFVVVYFAIKRSADEGMKRAIFLCLMTVATISCIVCVFQMVVDQSFFRVNPTYSRSAFAGLLRPSGVFRDDYMHSYIVFSALVWLSFTMKRGWTKNILSGLFLFGIFIAFMRMGYVVTTLFVAHAMIYASNVSFKLKVLVVTLAGIFGVFGYFLVATSGIMDSSIAQDRMMDEGTMELRYELYEKAIEVSFSSFQGILIGYGSVESPVYYEAMYEVTEQEEWALGERGGWHNLFISTLFFNGFPTACLLFITLVSIIKYFHKLVDLSKSEEYYIPFYICAGYVIANVTLSLELTTPFAVFLFVSVAIMVKSRKGQILNERTYEYATEASDR